MIKNIQNASPNDFSNEPNGMLFNFFAKYQTFILSYLPWNIQKIKIIYVQKGKLQFFIA